MRLIKPAALKTGDTIAVIAPSTFILDETNYQRGIGRLRDLGFIVREGRTLRLKQGYMAGSDDERASDVMEMFSDPTVKAIVCLVGGACADRLLDRLDYSVIAANPKIFTGLSDITHLHLALLSQANIMSLHHLDLLFGFGGEANNPAIEYGINLFTRITTKAVPLGKIPAYSNWEVWREGAAEGRLIGGWLPALGYLTKTQYWPDVGNLILFWEAIDLEIHDIDMILTTIRLKGVFEKVRGMLIGKTPGCEEKEFAGLAPSIRDLVTEITEPYAFPILANLDFGHVDENMPLPEGILARMDTTDKSVSLLESLVKCDNQS